MMIVHRIIKKGEAKMPKKTEEKNNKGKKKSTKTSAAKKGTNVKKVLDNIRSKYGDDKIMYADMIKKDKR